MARRQKTSCLRQRTLRSMRGALTAETAAGLILLTFTFLWGIAFLFGVGAASYYKYKISCVANRTAEYMAALVYFAGAANPNFSGKALPTRATELADRLLKNYGLPQASNVEASVNGRLLTVTVTVARLPLLHDKGGPIPLTIDLSDTAVVPIPRTEPPELMSLTNGGITVCIPAYGLKGSASFLNWTPGYFQADESLPAGSAYSHTN